MIYSVNKTGEFGLLGDLPTHDMPSNAWSAGRNVRFADGYAEKALGHDQVFGTPPVAIHFLLAVPQTANYIWLEMGLQKVYAYNGLNHTNITRQPAGVDVNYTGTADNTWTGCVLGGVPVINNGVDLPQQWLPASVATKLTALANWPVTATCKVMRNYKQFLVALNVTKSSVEYPTMVKWSHPADPGTVPTTWDETDPTKDAGEFSISETDDALVDCAVLRDTNILYKEGSVWGMQFIGGNDIFRFSKLFGQFGAVNQNCISEFLTGKHLVFALGDVIVHDGQSADSILTRKMRKWLENNLNSERLNHCYICNNPSAEELWVCLPTGASLYADKALIWNWRTGTLGIRDLPQASFIATGLIISDGAVAADAWSVAGNWESDAVVWGSRLYSRAAPSLLMTAPTTSTLFKANIGDSFDGVAQVVSLERSGISVPLKQQVLPDFTAMKFMRELWPRIEGTLGGVVNVSIGTQMAINGDVTWKPAQPYIIGTTRKINTTASGRSFAIKFESDTVLNWKLMGYEMDIEFSGNY
jgi:hypothetical protein